jgi:hypothetical protein
MAKTCATFAYLLLACSECHELFNHEASQSNDGDCWSAAGDMAQFFEFRMCQCKNVTIQQLTIEKHAIFVKFDQKWLIVRTKVKERKYTSRWKCISS